MSLAVPSHIEPCFAPDVVKMALHSVKTAFNSFKTAFNSVKTAFNSVSLGLHSVKTPLHLLRTGLQGPVQRRALTPICPPCTTTACVSRPRRLRPPRCLAATCTGRLRASSCSWRCQLLLLLLGLTKIAQELVDPSLGGLSIPCVNLAGSHLNPGSRVSFQVVLAHLRVVGAAWFVRFERVTDLPLPGVLVQRGPVSPRRAASVVHAGDLEHCGVGVGVNSATTVHYSGHTCSVA